MPGAVQNRAMRSADRMKPLREPPLNGDFTPGVLRRSPSSRETPPGRIPSTPAP